MGLALTETKQAEMEIPKEKDAKYTVSSKDGKITGTKEGTGARAQCKMSPLVRGKCEVYIPLGESWFSKLSNNKENDLIMLR